MAEASFSTSMVPGGIDPLKIVTRSISSLKLNPQNPRKHPKRQLQKLQSSIQTFGFVVPVLFDETGQLLSGHGRVEAARAVGMTEVPAIEVKHLTEAQKKAFIIADNHLTEIAEWNEPLLKQQLIEISQEDPDLNLEITGFEVSEIDLKISGNDVDSEDAAELDEPVIVGAGPAVTKLGMTWHLGTHRIHCGSSLDRKSFDLLAGDELADVGITDPPYNVPIDGHVSGSGSLRHREFAMAAGEMSSREFMNFLETALGNLCAVSKQGSLHYAFMDWRHAPEILSASQRLSLQLMNIAAWVKPNPGMGSFYRSQHEFCFIFKHGSGRHRNNVQLGRFKRNRSNVWNYVGANNNASTGEEGKLLALHPTSKPVRLIADIILDCTARGELVLDPFLGGGSTLIAAERVGRRCYGLELDPAYVDTAVRRWQAFTGEAALNAATGVAFDEHAPAAEDGPIDGR